MFARMAQSYNEHPTTRTADILKYGTIKLVHAYHLQKPISGLCAFADADTFVRPCAGRETRRVGASMWMMAQYGSFFVIIK